jgi:peroxiredoxin
MPMLKNGDVFPNLSILAERSGAITLPGDVRGAYAIILIYRGSWCPLCNNQLADYEAKKGALDQLGVKVIALSADDAAMTSALRNKLGLTFPIGVAADVDQVAAATGAFKNMTPHHLQPASFILDPEGSVMTAVYSTHAVGRLVAADAVTFISYMKAKAAAK